nr:uncharacterized protein LOC112936047 [Oryza sativa Japonica Group]
MESMRSFLTHLTETEPPGGEHDEQVWTWMKQVRELAQDCSNCIDTYRQHGDLAVRHPSWSRGAGILQRYIYWAPWMVEKLLAQHYAAIWLRELKDRAHDVGQRRLRYGVEVPGKPSSKAAGGAPSSVRSEEASPSTTSATTGAQAPDEEDEDEEEEEQQDQEYDSVKSVGITGPSSSSSPSLPSIAIVPPPPPRVAQGGATEVVVAAGANARDALASMETTHFDRSVWINLQALHLHRSWHQISTEAILCYILRECESLKKRGKDHGQVNPKMEEIEGNITKNSAAEEEQEEKSKGEAAYGNQTEDEIPSTPDGSMSRPKLAPNGGQTKYESILREVFPLATSKPHKVQEGTTAVSSDSSSHVVAAAAAAAAATAAAATTAATLEKVQIEQIIDKAKQDILQCILQELQQQLPEADKSLEENGWREIRNALHQLSSSGSAMVVTTPNIQKAKEICCPQQEPITNSIAGLYYDTLLKLTRKRVNKDVNQIFRDILDKCYPSEFCMKIFAHALYANPNRSKEDLRKLLDSLDSNKSLGIC